MSLIKQQKALSMPGKKSKKRIDTVFKSKVDQVMEKSFSPKPEETEGGDDDHGEDSY